MLRTCLALLGAAVALAIAAPGSGGDLRRLEAPSPANIGTPLDARYTGQPAFTPQLARLARWGGTYRAGDDDVTIYVSDSYAEDDALARRWAHFLGGLVHGAELSQLTLFLAPPAEVALDCPDEAYGCYAPGSDQIEAVGDDSAGVEPEAVVAHEYGHFIATYRDDDPWDAFDWGTKRWASYEDVCARVANGSAFPGDESSNYARNPGEAFAETYRMLNEGRAKTRWTLVTQSFYPDASALRRVREDVLRPWSGPTTVRLVGDRAYRLATPLDGTIELNGARRHPRSGPDTRRHAPAARARGWKFARDNLRQP